MLTHDDIAGRAHCELQGMVDVSTHDLKWLVEEYLAKAAHAMTQGYTVDLPFLGPVSLVDGGQTVYLRQGLQHVVGPHQVLGDSAEAMKGAAHG